MIDESNLGQVCHHGQLARSCNICELEMENAELRHLLAKERDDFGKKETELKAAYDEASAIAKKWCERGKSIEKLEAVARAAETALVLTENGADDASSFGRDAAEKKLSVLKEALAALKEIGE